MTKQLMPLRKQTVNIIIIIFATELLLTVSSEVSGNQSAGAGCFDDETLFENIDGQRLCVTVILNNRSVYLDEARLKCTGGHDDNLPVFVNQQDANKFTTQFVSQIQIGDSNGFFVDYQAVSATRRNDFDVEFRCLRPTSTVNKASDKKHYIEYYENSEEKNPSGQNLCEELEGDDGKSEVDRMFEVFNEKTRDHILMHADSAVTGQKVNRAIMKAVDEEKTARYTVCMRWLAEFQCDVPPEVETAEATPFLDGEKRFHFNGTFCLMFECSKDNVQDPHRTVCTSEQDCLAADREEKCLLYIPGDADIKPQPVPYIPPRESQSSVLSKSTIWVVIGGALLVLLLFLILVVYLVNINTEGESASMNPARNVFEYWRNRQSFQNQEIDHEPIETAYSAYSICDENSTSDSVSMQFVTNYSDNLRRTASTGASIVGGGSHGYPPTDYSSPPSQASSTNNVTGEPPPMYDEFYRRAQQRINSTNSINSAGEMAPAYTSRPVSAASSFLSLKMGGGGLSGPHSAGGSQFASISDMNNQLHQQDSTCQILPARGRNLSGKKVKFQAHPNPPYSGPKLRHASDMDPRTARRVQGAGLPNLSSSAGGSMMKNTLATHQNQPSSSKSPGHSSKELKPALRVRHRSAEQSRTMGQFGPTIAPGTVGGALPAIQPPPQHPGSRLLRNSSNGSGGNLLTGSSTNSILDEISGGASTHKDESLSKRNLANDERKSAPRLAIDTSVRQRHVSADQPALGRNRKDSDMIGLLDDQSPMILTPGSDGNSKNITVNPFLFTKDRKSASDFNSDRQNGQSAEGTLNVSNVSSSTNALTVRSPSELNPPMFQSASKHQRFSDQDLTENNPSLTNSAIRPRSKSVTDQNRQLNTPSSSSVNGNLEKADSGSGVVGYKVGNVIGSASGSKTSVASIEKGAPHLPKQGSINASYEDESIC